MLTLLLQSARSAVPADAVRDTVRGIIEGRSYARSVRSSLVGRAWRWLDESLRQLFGEVRDLPNARTIAVVAVVAIAALIVARIAYASRLGVEDLDPARRRTGAARATRLDDADRLAAAGEYLEAAHALYRAVLEVLARREGLRLHASKTSGDYLRELRRRGSPTQRPFAQFRHRYDRLVFGYAVCDAAAWQVLRAEAGDVMRREQAA